MIENLWFVLLHDITLCLRNRSHGDDILEIYVLHWDLIF